MSRMRFLVIKGGATWDMTNITSKVKISGRKGSSSRSLTATLLDDDNYGRPRPEIDVGEGVHCIFYWDNVELFRGIVERQRTSQKKRTTTGFTSPPTKTPSPTAARPRAKFFRTCAGGSVFRPARWTIRAT